MNLISKAFLHDFLRRATEKDFIIRSQNYDINYEILFFSDWDKYYYYIFQT